MADALITSISMIGRLQKFPDCFVKAMKKYFLILPLILILTSCQSGEGVDSGLPTSKEAQAKITPDEAWRMMQTGNENFAAGKLKINNTPECIKAASYGQYPFAVVLSCLDSRVPVEDVFQQDIGDIFVARVAGNISNADIVASLEYACKVSGAKLIVVMGHNDCGAVNYAIKGVELGNITGLLAKIQPSVDEAKKDFKGDCTYKNFEFTNKVSKCNVKRTVGKILATSPILKEMLNKGEIKIVSAFYDLNTGRVVEIQ